MNNSLMKKFLLFLITALATISASATKATIAFEKFSQSNGKGVAAFTLNSPENTLCALSFYILPVERDSNQFSDYTICVNNRQISTIKIDTHGWQMQTTPCTVELKAGENTITFTSSRNDLPQIRNLQIVQQPLLPKVASLKAAKTNTSTLNHTSPLRANVPNPYFKPGVKQNVPYTCTFTLALHYNAGDNAYFYAPSAWDPRFGMYESKVDFRLYFFYENPDSFSVSNVTTNKTFQWHVNNLPCTGTYYILAEALTDTVSAMSLYINGIGIYRNQIISNTTFENIEKNRHPNGEEAYNCYHLFTANSRSCNSYTEGDPCLWLKATSSNNSTPRIVAYNNDNQTPSDFDWGKNARIVTPLTDTTNYSLLLSSNNPLFFEHDTCDVYYSKWNQYSYSTTNDTVFPLYPNLRYTDAINSESADVNKYNCIAWSAGTIYEQISPDHPISYYDSLYNNLRVKTKTNSYFQRLPNSIKYTREGATTENSVVDLWGFITERGDSIVHATIRTPIDGIPHGYDWESKLGSSDLRMFHPRYAFLNSNYGQILYHYRIAENQDKTATRTNFYKMVADEEITVRTYQLTDEETATLSSYVSQIDNKNHIELLYDMWNKKTLSMKHLDMYFYDKNDEYKKLLEVIENTQLGEYFVYQKFIEGDFKAILLICKIYKKNSNAISSWETIMTEEVPRNVIYNQKSRVTCFIKELLKKETSNTQNSNKTLSKLSNTDPFNIIVQEHNVEITFNIKSLSSFSLYVVDLQTNAMELIDSQNTAQGRYQYTHHLASGIYTMVYYLNGNINCRKITVL